MTLLITLWIPDIQQGTTCAGLSDAGGTTNIDYGNYTKSDTNFHRSVATYMCNHGYTLVDDQQGNAITDDTITCDAASSNADWPSPRPKCVGTMIMFCAFDDDVRRMLI